MIYNISKFDQTNNIQCVEGLDIKISVIVPCYNVQNYIVRCVDSIMNQSIGCEKLEVILVNDASTDETYQTLLCIEKQYPEQVLVINCAENGRQGCARNIGLSYATGEYITFVDADDMIHPRMMECLVLGIINYQTQIAECELQIFGNESEISCDVVKDKEGLEQLFLVESLEEANIFFVNHAFDTSVCRRMYCRDFIEEARLFFPEQIFMEDIFFTQLAMVYCKSMYKIKQPLYYYFQNTNSTMHSDKLKTYYMDVHKVSVMVIEELKSRGYFEYYKESLKMVYEKKVLEDLTAYMNNTFEVFPDENAQIMKKYMESTFN